MRASPLTRNAVEETDGCDDTGGSIPDIGNWHRRARGSKSLAGISSAVTRRWFWEIGILSANKAE